MRIYFCLDGCLSGRAFKGGRKNISQKWEKHDAIGLVEKSSEAVRCKMRKLFGGLAAATDKDVSIS